MGARSLDTGRLNLETYQLFEAVEKHYGIHIEYTFPDAQETMDLVRAKGMFSFYEDGHQECCRVRKVTASAHSLVKSCLQGYSPAASPVTGLHWMALYNEMSSHMFRYRVSGRQLLVWC